MGFLGLYEKNAVVTSEVKKLAAKICGIMSVLIDSYLKMFNPTISKIPEFMIKNHLRKFIKNVFMKRSTPLLYLPMPSFFFKSGT